MTQAELEKMMLTAKEPWTYGDMCDRMHAGGRWGGCRVDKTIQKLRKAGLIVFDRHARKWSQTAKQEAT